MSSSTANAEEQQIYWSDTEIGGDSPMTGASDIRARNEAASAQADAASPVSQLRPILPRVGLGNLAKCSTWIELSAPGEIARGVETPHLGGRYTSWIERSQ